MGTELTKCCRSAENNQIEINLEAKTDHLIIKATPCKPENLVNKRNSSMLVSSCSSKAFTDDRFKKYKRKQSQTNVMNKADLDHKLVNMKNHLEELTKANTKEGSNVNEESQGDHSSFLMTSLLLSPNKKRRSFEVINEELTSHQVSFLRKILFTEGLLVEEMNESTMYFLT